MERYMILLKSFKRMPFEMETIIRESVYPISVRKHEIIQSPDSVNDNLYFVEKGLFHLYLPCKSRKTTFYFIKEDQFIITLRSLYSDSDGTAIEALEDSLLWCFPGSFVADLKKRFPQFAIQLNGILWKDWEAMRHATRCSRPDGGSSNYHNLLQYSPELLDRVPTKHLSNFTHMPEKILIHLHTSKIKLLLSYSRRRRKRNTPTK
jgi:hypothetical protein